jgi:hypothetical protein
LESSVDPFLVESRGYSERELIDISNDALVETDVDATRTGHAFRPSAY